MVSEQLLKVLSLCLLALLYLFFLRVLRAVWVGTKAPVVTAAVAAPVVESRRSRKQAPQGLTVVAPPELAGQRFAVDEELSIGRAAGCTITLDDTFASQMHARIVQRDGSVMVEDLGSTNGTWLNREKVTGPMVLRRGDHLQVGNTVMELT